MKTCIEYHQKSNSSKKFEVLTIENNCVLLFVLSLSLFISSTMLTLSSSSSDSSGRIEFDRSRRQAYGLMSMMKLLEIKPLKGDKCSFSRQRADLNTIDVQLESLTSSF